MNILEISGVLLLGLILGQAANYLADVLPIKRKMIAPSCRNCQADLPPAVYLGMKICPQCQTSPAIRRWILLVLYPVLLVFLWVRPHERLGFWLSALVVAYLVLIAVIDIEHKLILFVTSIAGGLIAAGTGIVLHGFIPTLLGGGIGFAVMYLLYLLGAGFMILVNKIRQKPVDEIALGFGDVSLTAVLGLLLGFPGILLGVFFAIILGGVFSGLYLLVTYIRKRYQPLAAIPYAPFLIISALILLFRG